MNITEVRIRLLKKDDTKLKAVATITIDNYFVVHDIKVIQGESDLFIAMPSKKMPSGEYKDIVHPLNTETREMLRSLIVAEYRKAVAAAEGENA
ncbi:MAG: septation regulator SpoVG [Clostridia bacterium]|nr:septation regulator SpoVG [Clostridia bacterium]